MLGPDGILNPEVRPAPFSKGAVGRYRVSYECFYTAVVIGVGIISSFAVLGSVAAGRASVAAGDGKVTKFLMVKLVSGTSIRAAPTVLIQSSSASRMTEMVVLRCFAARALKLPNNSLSRETGFRFEILILHRGLPAAVSLMTMYAIEHLLCNGSFGHSLALTGFTRLL